MRKSVWMAMAGSLMLSGVVQASTLDRIQKRTNDAVRKEAEDTAKEKAGKHIDKATEGKGTLNKTLNRELKAASDEAIEDTSEKADLSKGKSMKEEKSAHGKATSEAAKAKAEEKREAAAEKAESATAKSKK